MSTDKIVTPTEFRTVRKFLEGSVVSDKMQKTRIVRVDWQTTDPRYHKVVRRSTRVYAHDETNESHTGDKVEITETRPMSRNKRWRISKILEKAA